MSETERSDRELIYIEKGTRVITNGPSVIPDPPTSPSGLVPAPASTDRPTE